MVLENIHAVAQLSVRQAPDPASLPPPQPYGTYPYPYSELQHIGFFILFFFPSIALLVVCLRMYSRVSTKTFGWDDSLIVLAMMFSIAETGASYMGMRTAFLGVHVYDIPLVADRTEGLKWNYILQLLYNPILALVKSSVLLFMLRLGGQNRNVRYTIHALNFFNIGLMIAIFITVIFQCTPVEYFWLVASPNPPQGTCINTGAFYVATAGLTILTDVLVLVLPFWIFLGLKMPLRVRLALIAVFAMGAIVTVISILRLLWITEVSFYINMNDPTYDIRFTYSAVETNLAIVAASAPALRGLFLRWFPRFFASLRTGSNKYKYGNKYADGGENGRSTNQTADGLKSAGGKEHHKTRSGTFQLRDMKGRSEIRSHSPSTSEEEIMTYDGIMRTTEVRIAYGDKDGSMKSGGPKKTPDAELGKYGYSSRADSL